jgi:DNA-binding MarR family transcriptional regulator
MSNDHTIPILDPHGLPDYENDPEFVGNPRAWVRIPEWDTRPGAQYRREIGVAFFGSLASSEGAATGPGAPDSACGSDAPGLGPASARAESCDVLTTTPFMLVRAGRALRRRLPSRTSGPDPLFGGDLVLLEIARVNGTTPRKLGRRLGLPQSTVSTIVARHLEAGLIRRERHPRDGRTWRLKATGPGRQAAATLAAHWRAADEALLSGLTAGERDEFRRLLWKAGSSLARSPGRS